MTLSEAKKELTHLIAEYRGQLSDTVEYLIYEAIREGMTKAQLFRLLSRALQEVSKYDASFYETYVKLLAEYKAALLGVKDLDFMAQEIRSMFKVQWVMQDAKGTSRTYTFDEAIKEAQLKTSKEIRSLVMGAYLSGDQVYFSKRAFGRRRAKQLRTLTETWLYVTRNKTNLDILKTNHPDSWVFYHTQEDERVDDVCHKCSSKTAKVKWSPKEYDEACLPPLHFNCRCNIEPIYADDILYKDAGHLVKQAKAKAKIIKELEDKYKTASGSVKDELRKRLEAFNPDYFKQD